MSVLFSLVLVGRKGERERECVCVIVLSIDHLNNACLPSHAAHGVCALPTCWESPDAAGHLHGTDHRTGLITVASALQSWLVSPAPVSVYTSWLLSNFLLPCISVIISCYESLLEENKQICGKGSVFSCFLSSLLFPPPLLQLVFYLFLEPPATLRIWNTKVKKEELINCFLKERKNNCHFERQIIFSF